MSTAFERIRDTWVPNWLKGFELKSRDYNSIKTGWEPHEVLGIKGQFADLWRKVGKLKKALWDDEPLEGEQPLEIIDDLISHLFLTRDLLIQQESQKASAPEQAVTALQRLREGWTPDELSMGHRFDGCPVCLKRRKDREERDAFTS